MNAENADADVVVIGAGPNGLTAAALLARAGLRVLVLEGNDAIGGAARTAEVTLPGFRHDPFSAFFPLARAGPLRDLPLEEHGLRWHHWPKPYGGAVLDSPGFAQRLDLAATIAALDRAHPGDGAGWRELYGLWRRGGGAFQSLLFNPLGHPAPLFKALPLLASPTDLFRFAQATAGSARALADRFLQGKDARVWLMGSVAHSDLTPDDAAGGGFGLLLCALSQKAGMPIPEGGAQAIPEALARLLAHHGGRILTGHPATRIVVRDGRAVAVRTPRGEFAARRAVLATTQPKALFLDLVGEGHLPQRFVRLVHGYRWGSGTFQINCALSALPRFRAHEIDGTLVVHLARSEDELTRATVAPRRGALPAHPLLIAGFHTLADPTRAPAGRHTLWAMTHVPTRIRSDDAGAIGARTWAEAKQAFTERLLDEIETFAPGFRSSILGVHAQSPEDLEAANPNLVGGDIGTGTYTLDQQVVFRPFPGYFRHKTPIAGLYVSGAATHPGGGVHGAAGANAARVLLADLRLRPLGRALATARRRLPHWP
jgi:phytoene dehydrogenase-like protein